MGVGGIGNKKCATRVGRQDQTLDKKAGMKKDAAPKTLNFWMPFSPRSHLIYVYILYIKVLKKICLKKKLIFLVIMKKSKISVILESMIN